MLLEFKSLIPFVESLGEVSAKHWNQPIAAGKWALKDIICHLMLWDKYFYEGAIKKIILREPITTKQLDFNEFNANAVEYAKLLSEQTLIEQFVRYRTKIIDVAAGLTEEEFNQEYKDGDRKKFSVRKYLRSFIPHDKHHKKQIEQFLKP
ncbi:DinB superfamily protein [compost metagenome]